MSEALIYINVVFTRFTDFVFNTMVFDGVSVGWVCMIVVLLSFMVYNIIK